MITIIPTRDVELIKQIHLSDDLYELNYLDGCLPREQWEPRISEFDLWLLIYEDDNLVGSFHGEHFLPKIINGHINILKKYRGREALKYGEALKAWFKQYPEGPQVIALVPERHEHVKRYLRRLGYSLTGIIHSAVLIHGKPDDIFIYQDVE